jgi:hypothetical protein
MTTTPRVRASGPDDLIAVVPYLLGFHPRDSIVLVGLVGEPSTVGVSMRLDLVDAADSRCDLSVLVQALVHGRASGVVILVYAADEHRDVVARVGDACRAAGIDIRDALRVHDGRRWSYLCSDPTCCPAEGAVLTDASTVAAVATAVVAGMVAAEDRSELVAELAPRDGLVANAMRAAVERHLARWAALVSAGGRPARVAIAEDHACVDRAMRRRLAGDESPLDVDDAARVLLALQDVLVRDAAFRWFAGNEGRVAQRLWVELTRLAPDDLVAAPATLAAVTAYCQGDGARAAVALDRALAGQPDYRMAVYLKHALRNAMKPAEIREICASTVETLELDGELAG